MEIAVDANSALKSNKFMFLSIIVPAYNEAKCLAENIKKFNQYLNEQKYDYEIIIVNDGSTDNTGKIGKQLAAKNKNIKLINNKINKGKGAAVRQGLLQASGEYALFIDADNATSIDHLKQVWPYFKKGYDIVIGTRSARDAQGACQAVPQARWKRLLGVCGNYIIRLLAVKNIRDTQCGFKVFRKKAVKNIIPQMTIDGFAFDAEMLALAQYLDFKIAKIPVYWVNYPNSRVGIKGYLSSLKDICRIKWNFIRGKYKVKNKIKSL
jgi:dolichyl-phosphate beta-glucosyltransferase